MAVPTDRGYVAVIDGGDGTTTVEIAARMRNGRPVDVYATHVGSSAVVIHPEVSLVRDGPRGFTTEVVEVFSDDAGTVHVAGVRSIT